MALTITITDAGRAALVNAAHNGTAPVVIAQAGLTAATFTAAPAATALPGEHKRLATLSGSGVAADTIHLVVRDESAGVYTVRGFALYLADGTLFAIYGQPAVLLDKSAQAVMLLGVDIRFADIDAATLSFGDSNWLNPPATTEVQGIVELATEAETGAGIDVVRAVTPKGVKSAFTGWAALQFADVWRASNDGSGSGLDADLLDGADLSTIMAHREQVSMAATDTALENGFRGVNFGTSSGSMLTFAPAGLTSVGAVQFLFRWGGELTWRNRTNNLGWEAWRTIWHSGNDGSGSGLDADLLDGQDGGYYTNIAARLGYTPLNAASYTPADVLAKLVSVDGSGSGLDADLLDGFHAADLLPAGALDANGWCRLPNGLVLQWGQAYAATDSYLHVTFPVAFPAACLHINAGAATQVGNNSSQDNGPVPSSATTTGATFWNASTGANTWWLAIGC